MKKPVILFLAVLILSAFPVMATGGSQTQTAGAQTFNIAVFEGGEGRVYWDDMAARFQASHPNIRVNMRADPEIGNILTPEIASGQWPDFISLSQNERSGVIISMIMNRQLLELTDLFNGPAPDRPGVALKDVIVPGILETTWCSPDKDGRIFLAPFMAGPMGLVYNKALFESKGWRLPVTWDDFFALDTELRKPENYVTIDGQRVKRSLFTYQGIYAGYLESLFWPAVAGAGGPTAIANIEGYRQGSFDNASVRSVVEAFARFATGDYLMEGTVALNHTQSQTDMMLGKALFIPNGTWMENEMADAPREPGFTFGLTPAPVLRAGQDSYVLSSMGQLSIPRAARNPELAKEFLLSVYSRNSVVSLARNANNTIAVKDALSIAGSNLSSGVAGMFTAYDRGKFMLFAFDAPPANTRVNTGAVVFDDNMGPLVTGRITPAEYIRRVEAAFAEMRDDIARSR
jgi:N-acetylglucosamine transport system substrate-binding protein